MSSSRPEPRTVALVLGLYVVPLAAVVALLVVTDLVVLAIGLVVVELVVVTLTRRALRPDRRPQEPSTTGPAGTSGAPTAEDVRAVVEGRPSVGSGPGGASRRRDDSPGTSGGRTLVGIALGLVALFSVTVALAIAAARLG